MKKIVSALLIASILAGSSMLCFATEYNEDYENVSEDILEELLSGDDEVTEGEEVIEGEEPEIIEQHEGFEIKPASDPDAVARVYLCSKFNKLPKPGHFFVYIENLTDEPIMVGLYEVPVNAGCSLAVWGFQKSDGFGLYYNCECYHYTDSSYSRTICISEEINQKELEKVSRIIKNSNQWDLFINCTFFACRVWNHISWRKVIPCIFPIFVRLGLRIHGSTEMPWMYRCSKENVLKAKSFGNWSRVQGVSEGSLD